ncbi:MAG: RNA polymerase sigma factor [Hespellia sp.]|nr:RNA polymerase sigma factor [Hespellia sp.]
MEILIRKAKNGDPKAFEELMREQIQMMYKAAKSILKADEDVADAVQDTILCCWEKLGQLREVRYFKTWLTRILINKCNDVIKHKKEFMLNNQLQNVAVIHREYENVEWNEMLKLLDEKYRLVIMLYYVEGFKTSEISQILDMPEATVRTRLARGRDKLADMYEIRTERRG